MLYKVGRSIGLQTQLTEKHITKKFLLDTRDQLFVVLPKGIKYNQFLIEDTFLSYQKSENNSGKFTKIRRRGNGGNFIFILSTSVIE